ncbi:cytochrome P450 [Aspergillus taichungensis]|uniref:Cytochrome P450 n=1 Tax=Aspergillus taichungensis TaxID=482145 RepID=A0A2J5HWT1_9EURO|nr:cytochrome P450 [Aspergillus taichungensis]
MLVQEVWASLSLARLLVGVLGISGILSVVYTVYNRFFHPLRHVPGPWLATVTPFVQLYHGLQGDRHLWLHALHKKYGSHVRVAPNFVSVNTAQGLHDIYGHGKKLKKANFYNAFTAIKGVYNTHNVIDKTVHGRKRRVLSQAFSDHALKAMEDVVLLHVRQLCDKLANSQGSTNYSGKEDRVRNLASWFSWLTYDVMGELCFGKSFDMLQGNDALQQKKDRRQMVGLVDRAANRHYVCGLWTPLDTWHLDQIVIHKLTNDRWNFIKNSRVEANERAKERTKAGHDSKKDFFYYLLNAKDPETGRGLTTAELWGEANVLMIAGSDTTSTTMAATMFYLLRNNSAMERLKNEILENFNDVEEIISGPKLNELVYLKACIDEALRMAPAVPGAIPREVIDGAMVDGVYLPPGTDCGTPTYSIHRQEEYYREAEAYIPERWIDGATCQTRSQKWTTTKEDVEIARKAFCPFSIGPRGCIGKSMAMMELRLTIARLIFLFNFDLYDREGEDENGHLALVDHFTSAKNGPNVIATRRV